MSRGPHWGRPIAVVDLETTGLSHANGDRIIEVAIIRLDGVHDPAPARFSCLVNPHTPIPDESRAIHGITDGMVGDAPGFAGVADDIERLLQGAVFVAHNARFDLGFLQAEFERVGRDMPVLGPIVDTLRVARTVFAFPSCALGSLATRMDLKLENHHRALDDADAALEALRHMLRSIDPKRTETVDDFLEYVQQMKKGGTERATMKRRLVRAAKDRETVEIEYTAVMGTGALTTTRVITVAKMLPKNVQAWCHLRADERIFRLDRIHRVSAEAVPN